MEEFWHILILAFVKVTFAISKKAQRSKQNLLSGRNMGPNICHIYDLYT